MNKNTTQDVAGIFGMFKIPIIGAILVVAFIILKPFTIIDAGHRGVVLNFGAVSDVVLDEGIHFIIPLVQTIKEIDVRVLKSETPSQAASRDLQKVSSVIALNYHLSRSHVNEIYQNVGMDVEGKIIDPAVQEIVKASTALYTAEQLITERSTVSLQINEKLVDRLKKYHIIIDDFSIKDFSFSRAFNEAIEAKQTAEQEALKAEREVRRVRAEAEQKVARARAEAEELRLKRQQITPMMVQMEWIKKWDGNLPTYIGGDKSGILLNMSGVK